MNFVLFLLLNAVLLLRPEELFPEITGLHLYLIIIAACILTTGPYLLVNLRPEELAARPITLCVLGVWAAGILSQLMRGQIGVAADFAAGFGKVMLYYLILVSVLDSASRLRAFLGWIVVFVTVVSTLGLLQYHGVVDFEALRPLERKEYSKDEEEAASFLQLRGTGIYNDPNDLCLILVTGSISALFRAVNSSGLLGRLLWLSPIGIFGYALVLTQSRGGLLGFLIAGLTWVYSYFGLRKTLLLLLPLSLIVSLLGGGRQINMSLGSEDTAYGRVELWASGLTAMMQNPVTGIGVGRYEDEAGLVAHNSYIHAYVEMGLVGGSLFVGAFYLSVRWCSRVGLTSYSGILRIRPFVLAILVGYAGGIFSVSRDYVVPTYLVIGLADAYLRIALPAPSDDFRVTGRMVVLLFGIGMITFLFLRLLTAVMLAMGR